MSLEMASSKSTANVLAEHALLDLLDSRNETPFSKAAFQAVLRVLGKVSLPSSLDHVILQKLYDCLRSWSSSKDISLVLPLLARVYDNLIHRDLGQPDVSNSVCELLFLIEDMADDQVCKIVAGEHFLQRLIALAGSKLTSIKLQRAAVETLSSLILMCPTNQEILAENFVQEWHKLVKKVLPLCGDFFVQASIVEILYRLSKRNPRLLECLEEQTLRGRMSSLHQIKKPDLLAETRSFLEQLNQSLGKSRSVYSFLAEDIIFDSRSTPLKDEKWVHFGMDHMSCYAALDADSFKDLGKITKSVSLLDVYFNRVCDIQVCSNHSVEFAFREPLPQGQDAWFRIKTSRLKVVLKSKDLEILRDCVLLRINHYQKELQKGDSKGVDSDNTNTTPSFSANAERCFRKASIGYAIPLPRKFKLPTLPRSSSEQVDINGKVSGNLRTDILLSDKKGESKPFTKGTSSKPTYDEAAFDTECIDKEVADHNAARSLTQVFQVSNTANEKTNSSPGFQSEERKSLAEADKGSGLKQNLLSFSLPLNNPDILPPLNNGHLGAKKINRNSPQRRKDTGSSCPTNACLNTKNFGLVSHSPTRSKRTGFGSPHESPVPKDNGTQPRSQYELAKKVKLHDTEGVSMKEMQHDLLSKERKPDTKEASTPKVGNPTDTRQAANLEEKILTILNNPHFLKSNADDTRKQKKSSSDPIETDSEQKRSVSTNKIGTKILSKSMVKQKLRDHSGNIKFPMRQNKKRSCLQLGKDKNSLNRAKKAPQKDVYAFDEDQESPAEDLPCTAAKDSRVESFKYSKYNLAKDQHSPAKDPPCTEAKDRRVESFKSSKYNRAKDQHSPAKDQQFTTPKDSKNKPPKVTSSKSRDNDNIVASLQTDTAAVPETLRTVTAIVAGPEEACLFRSPHPVRRRKRGLDSDSPAKKIKPSRESTCAFMDDGPLFAREIPACFASLESPVLVGRSNDKLEKELSVSYSSPKGTNMEEAINMSWKFPCFTGVEEQPQVRSETASPAKERAHVEPCRRARRRNQRFSQINQKALDANTRLLNVNIEAVETVEGGTVTSGEMELLAALVQKMMKKIKIKTENKSAQILSCAMDAVHQRCQEVQDQIKADLDDCTKTSRQTLEQLHLQLEEQHEAFLAIQKKWRNEFNNSLTGLKDISSQVESSQTYLKSLSDKQKNAHRRLFSNMGEFVELHLSETEQKLLALQKGARSIRNELKGALLQIF